MVNQNYFKEKQPKLKRIVSMLTVTSLTLATLVNGVDPMTAAAAKKKIPKKIQLTRPYSLSAKSVSSTLTIQKGKTFQLKYKISPAKAKSSARITFKSSKKKIASVSKKGKIKAKKVGKAKITIQSRKNKKVKATVLVSVVKKLAKVKKISLDKESLSLVPDTANSSYTLKATIVSPENPTVKKFNWYSSDAKVASVSKKGVVTAKKAGSAKITVASADGQGAQAVCRVTVSDKGSRTSINTPGVSGTPGVKVSSPPASSQPSGSSQPTSPASSSPSDNPTSPSADPSSNPSVSPDPSTPPTVPLAIVSGGRTGIKQGESLTLTTEGTYTGAVKWSVTEKDGVSISDSGVLTVASGTTAGGKITVTASGADNSVSATASFTIVEDLTPVLTEDQIQLNQDSSAPYGLTYRSEEAYSNVSDPERGDVIRFDASKGYTSSSYDVLAWMDVDPKYAGKTVTISAYMKYEKSDEIKKKLNLIINERWGYSNPAYKYNAEPDTWYHVTGTYTFPANTGSKYTGSTNRLYICRDSELTSGINAVYYIDDLMFYVDKAKVSKVTVKAAGNATTVYQNHTLQFTSTVTGTGGPAQDVTYSIDPAVDGASIDAKGLLTVGNAAPNSTITVKATSVDDPSVSGTTTVKVLAQTIDALSITADKGATEIYQGNSIQLRASATSTGDPDTSVTWSIEPPVKGASISSNGLLSVEDVADGTEIHVKATSVFDKSKSATYTLTVRANKINSVTITSAGNKTTVSSDLPLRLSAEIDASGTPSDALTWSIPEPVDGASLASSAGSSNTLSVTAAVKAGTKITVRATSDFDPTKYGEIQVTVEDGGGKTFDINKLDVEYFENFDTTGATLETIKASDVLSWKFTEPADAEFSPTLTNASFVKIYKNFGIFKTDDKLTTAQRRTAAFQGFFGDKEDYLQFKVQNTGGTDKTYTLSFMFRFADIDADKSYINSQMASNTSFVSYQLPLKLVAVDDSEQTTTVTNNIKIPFRDNRYATSNKEYYDISGSVTVPAGKTVRLRLMLDGDLPGCISPDHMAQKEGYDTMPHPCSFTVDNVAISTGDVPDISIKAGETYDLNLDTLETDTVKYSTNCYLSQFTYREGKDTGTGSRFESIPATVDATGKITASSPGDTTLIAEITHQDGSITRKQCVVHVTE